MIFVLDSYLKRYKAELREWENNARDWAARKNAGGYSYHYYSYKEYPVRRPGIPVIKWAIVLPIVLMPLFVVGMVTLLSAGAPTGAEVDKTAQNPNGCHVVVQKGDKVAIKDGDFAGSKGDVISQDNDCHVNLTLTDSTWSMDRCKKVDRTYCQEAKDNGNILTVNSSKDIIKL